LSRDCPISRGGGSAAISRSTLYIDGKLAADRELPVTIPINIGITEGLTCGRDEGSPVTDSYEGPFPFTGKLDQVAIDVSGNLIEDREAQMRSIISHQ
jgi:arylsulfatase